MAESSIRPSGTHARNTPEQSVDSGDYGPLYAMEGCLALPDATAPTIASVLDERIFSYFSLPEEILTDQGVQFEADLTKELCASWWVGKVRTTLYHPQGNCQVERGNRLLGYALRTQFLNRKHEEWDLMLPQLMRAARGTPTLRRVKRQTL